MITLSIALSEQCNLNCSYCNVDKLSQKSIDPDLFLENFQKIRFQNPDTKIKIDFYGGEPLLQWNSIFKIIENTYQDSNIDYYLPTNGLLLNDERIEYLNKHNVFVSLSFDGLWQDMNRPQHDNKSSAKAFEAKIPLFRKLRRVECHTMVNQHTTNLLENHLYIIRTLGLNPNLTLIRDIGTWDNESAQKFNDSFDELLNWYIENSDRTEMPNLIKYYLEHVLSYVTKKTTVENCGAGITHLSFTENKIIPCNRFKTQESIDKIKQYAQLSACQTCEVKNYCKKGCLYETIKNQGPISELCHIYKHVYKETIKLTETLRDNSHFKQNLREMINES